MKGLRESLSGLVSDFALAAKTRVELFGLELAEEKSRLLSLAALVLAAIVCLVLALLVFSLLIAALFWDTEHRYLALGLLAGTYAVIGLGLVLFVRARIVSGPSPFSHTMGELRRDAAALAAVRGSVQSGEERPPLSREDGA